MVPVTKETGERTSNTVKALRLGLMVQRTRVNTLMERRMGMGRSFGLMEARTLANSVTIILRGEVSTVGVTRGFTRVTGSAIRWRVMATSCGLMVVATKEPTLTIRRRDRVYSIGLMGAFTTEHGRMESRMELANIPLTTEKTKWGNGKMGSG